MLKVITILLLQAQVYHVNAAVSHVVSGWSPQVNPYAPINVNVGDSVTFVWTGNHNVHKLSVDNCATTNTNLITSISNTAIPITASDAGRTFIFACGVGNHCESGQKVQVVVSASIPTPTAFPIVVRTAPPTPKPIPSTKCSDDSTWFQVGKPTNTCLRVATATATRCAWVSPNGVVAKDGCPVTCGNCPPSGTSSAPTPKPIQNKLCENSVSWFQVGKAANTCLRVAALPTTRCSWVSSDGTPASIGCPLACGTCIV